MSDPDLEAFYLKVKLSGKVGEKVVVPQHDLHRALRRLRQSVLAALHIPAMNHQIRLMYVQHLEIIVVFSMGIADDQYLHSFFSSSFIRRRAFPL